jgi:phosphoglycolate phosphatase
MHVIFDFDGTIVDSFVNAMTKFNILADEFNFRKLSQDELPGLRDLSSKDLIKYLKIPIYKIPSVLYRARKLMSSEMASLSTFVNLPGVLNAMHNANFSLGILTSNSESNVTQWLEVNKLRQLFGFIHVESNYFGKNRIIKKIIKKYNMNKSQVFYIGDETRDIDAAKQNEIFSVAVTWGFNSEKILLQQSPHHVARKPEDLLATFGLGVSSS